MRVLFDYQVFSYQQTGGVSRYFAELIHHLPDFGVAVSTGFRQTVNRYLHQQGYKTFLGNHTFKGKTHLLAAWNKLQSIRALKAGDFDVFHPTYYDPYFLKYIGDKPFVLTIHDMIHELYPESVSDAYEVQTNKLLLAHKAAMVIAVSENTRQDAIRLLQLDPAKVVTVHHGNALTPESTEPSKIAPPERFILYVGGRATYKNADLIWKAFADVCRQQPDVFLVHVGGGDFSSDEQAVLVKLGIAGKVIHLAADDNGLSALYRSALCLVYPSLYEGFGLPLIEAMAFDCPVLAARASCLPEIGGDAGVYVDPDDQSAWTAAIQAITRADSRNNSTQTHSRLAQAKKYDWTRAVQQTRLVYENAQEGSN